MEKVQLARFGAMQNDDEEATLVQAAQNHPAGFQPLYERWVTPVYRYLLSRLASPAEAEDLTSQVFLKALEELPRYHHRGRFAAWLFTIARNLLTDRYRRSGREQPLEGAAGLTVPADLLSGLIQSDQVRHLRELILALPLADQELLRLRYTAGLSYAEMAHLLGRSEEAVKKSTYRLLARLHSQLETSHG